METEKWLYPLALFMILDFLSTIIGIYFYGAIEQNMFLAPYYHANQLFVPLGLYFIFFFAIYGINEMTNTIKDNNSNVIIITIVLLYGAVITSNTIFILSKLLL